MSGCVIDPAGSMAEMNGEDARSATQAVEDGVAVTHPNDTEAAIVHLYGTGCTGTLIRPNWVLTARHCLVTTTGAVRDPAGIQAQPYEIARSAPAAEVIPHPDISFDVGLVRLASPIDTPKPFKLFSGWDQDLINGTFKATTTLYGLGPISSEYFHGIQCADNPCGPNETCHPEGTVVGPDGTTMPAGSRCIEVLANPPFPHWTLSKNTNNAIVNLEILGNNQGCFNGKYIETSKYAIPGDSGGPAFLPNGELVSVNGGWANKVYAKVFRNWVMEIIEPTVNLTFPVRNTHGYFGLANEHPMTGDFNGDGRADLVTFIRDTKPGTGAGDVYVALANANGVHQAGQLWHGNFGNGPPSAIWVKTADFDGDRRDDIIAFDQRTGEVTVGHSNGVSGFVSSVWHTGFFSVGEVPDVGDFNGDARADIVSFVQRPDSQDVWVSFSCRTDVGQALPPGCAAAGSTFGARQLWATNFSQAGEAPRVGDFNGDYLDDIATFTGNGDVEVALSKLPSCTVDADCPGTGCLTDVDGGTCWASTGDGTRPKQLWLTGFAYGGQLPRIGDVNGDGFDDIVNFELGSAGDVSVALYNGSTFGPKFKVRSGFATAGQDATVGDVNRDGRGDLIVFQLSTLPGANIGDVWVGVSKGTPAAWTCPAQKYDARDGCDCDCGTVDPDCSVAGQAVVGCSSGVACTPHGVCDEPDEPPLPQTPCTDLCQNPTVLQNQSTYVSLGTQAGCYQSSFPLQSANCGNLPAGRTMRVNGTVVTCNYQNITLPPARNGGYCFTVPAGGAAWNPGLNTW